MKAQMTVILAALIVFGSGITFAQQPGQGADCGQSYDEYVGLPNVVIDGREYPAVRVFVDGVELDSRGFIRAGNVYMCAREMLEGLGGTVVWSQRERSFYGQFPEENRTVQVTVGSRTAVVYTYSADRPFGAGRRLTSVDMGIAPFQAGGRVYVPVRGVAEAAGAQLQYDPNARIVRITT